MFRHQLAAVAVAASVVAGGARAAENYLTMPQPWTGFYVGGTIGGGWGDAKQHNTFTGGLNATVTMSGVIGGVVGGYNWQFDRFVLGLEADASLSSITGSTPGAASQPCLAGAVCTESINSLITGRVRVGLPIGSVMPSVGDVMPFVTGGVAFGDVHGASGANVVSGWQTGYVLGGGVDVALHDGWAARGEYLFVNLGSASAATPGPATQTNTVDATHILRLAITKQIP